MCLHTIHIDSNAKWQMDIITMLSVNVTQLEGPKIILLMFCYNKVRF